MDSEDEVYLEEERARRVGMSIQEVRDSYTRMDVTIVPSAT